MTVASRPQISDRVARLKERLVNASPRLSVERVSRLLESYRATDGQPPVLRRARAFAHILGRMTIFIDDNSIVGTLTQYYGGVQPYPEFSCEWMVDGADFFGPLGKIAVSGEDRAVLREAVEYWGGRCVAHRVDELWAERHPDGPSREALTRAGVFHDIAEETLGRINIDYGKVISQGLGAVGSQARLRREALPIDTLASLRKRDFLEAAAISCDAIGCFAGRYASLAAQMADAEPDGARRAELRQIAEACTQVPAGPARTFREGVLAFWLVHVACLIGNCASGVTPGRLGQFLFPLYRADLAAGRISEDEALELLECLFIRFSEISKFAHKKHSARSQGTMFQNISLGGVSADGRDATCEVDFLLIEAQRCIRTIQPTLSVLYHDAMPPAFLLKAAELVSTGIGMPAFFNSSLNVQRLLDHGATLEDARNHCIIGCVEAGFSHCAGSMRSGFFNMPKMLELALNDGLDPLSGSQLGPHTGIVEGIRSSADLSAAVGRQLSYMVGLYNEARELGRAVTAELMPLPWESALVDGCIESGCDEGEGGARYYMNGGSPVGAVDLADSLTAIRTVIYEQGRWTLSELRGALKDDFRGHDEMLRALIEAPKYGNDDETADGMVREWYDAFYAEHQKSCDYLGKTMRPAAISVAAHFPFGQATGALPSGRKARLPLTDATVSPEPGKDTRGPTALVRSATRALDTTKYASGQLNMKFHPTALDGLPGKKNLLALVKSYMDLGGHHVQFNVVSVATLKDAQLHPEKYRDLVVRVAGFSAFFIHLDPEVQAEIIKRTELRFK